MSLPQVAEAILEWSAASSGEDGDDQTPSPAELCSTTDAEGKTAIMFAKENVRLRYGYGGCVLGGCVPVGQWRLEWAGLLKQG